MHIKTLSMGHPLRGAPYQRENPFNVTSLSVYLAFRAMEGISCEAGDAIFNACLYSERKRHGKISLPVPETPERIREEKEERRKETAQAGEEGG